MNNAKQFVGLGIAFGGLLVALNGLFNDFETVEKRGLTIASGVALLTAGIAVANDIEDVERRAKHLFG